MTESEFAELAAGYALHALSPEDERAFLDALRAHPEWQGEADAAAAAASALADAAPPVSPPPALRDAILGAVAVPTPPRSRAATPPRPAAPVGERPARRGWFGLAASIVAIAVLAVSALFVTQQLGPTPASAALAQIERAPDAQSATVALADGEATAHWSASVGEAVLVTDGIPAVTDAQTFQLWLVRDGEAISAGLFEVDDQGDATALLDGGYQAGDVIAVTVEQAGGSPTGAPTGDPILAFTT